MGTAWTAAIGSPLQCALLPSQTCRCWGIRHTDGAFVSCRDREREMENKRGRWRKRECWEIEMGGEGRRERERERERETLSRRFCPKRGRERERKGERERE